MTRNLDDAYMSHIYTERYLLVASEQYLWIIERRTNEPERLRWEEISHFWLPLLLKRSMVIATLFLVLARMLLIRSGLSVMYT
jgi:hypothetical protein